MAYLQSIDYSQNYDTMDTYPEKSKRIYGNCVVDIPGKKFNGYANYPEAKFIPETTDKATLLELLKSSRELEIFYNLCRNSCYKDLLNDPRENNLTLFVPSDEAFRRMTPIVSDVLKTVSVDTFVGYHIVKARVVVADMNKMKFYVDTYGDEGPLYINGMGLTPKIGKRFMLTTTTPEPNQEASIVLGDIQAKNGVLHAINRPLISETVYKGY